ncbi:nuclear transport factor 2 family protein [Streptomyces sp. SP18CS02]|uniref:nuclear transport factor 2 family protein n=1 Tax=Streptomyces sp. SP18CS02 TaxID=3002531 RepID=UPI002E7A575B|nr:nuclear transport factor 2 family protein [Streptomyces sp. SP18CS02]MEE1753766.1 nuclear transport factor 2 family protein [Streptomyces sp. SP18CS02]
MTAVTPELIEKAYVALVSCDREEAVKYWSEDVRFQVPGRHAEAGWRVGLDDLLAFRRSLTAAAGGKFDVELVTSMINGNESMDVVKVHAVRPGAPEGSTSPYDVLDAVGVQVFRWSDGLIVEGIAGFFGDGSTNYDQWWSPLGADGERRDR